MKKIDKKVWFGFFFLLIIMALALFIPAGTIYYWQAWAYLILFFGLTLAVTLYLAKKDPALLARRSAGGPQAEKRTIERTIMLFAGLGFVSLLVIPALDRRMNWSQVPVWLSVVGYILFLFGWIVIFFVFRENSFTSTTIEVAKGQKVITTGPYAVVRHPMYAGALVYLIGTPLALGSYWGYLGLAFMMPFLIWRLFDEERVLSKDLAGYIEYCAKVRWRLIPKVF